MFDSLVSKILLLVAVVLLVCSVVLSVLLFRTKQENNHLVAELDSRNAEIASLNSQIAGLNLLIKQNDEIATKTIDSLNNTVKLCQQKQDEIIDFCDKRVRLALESFEVDIALEASDQIEDVLKGIDKNSSIEYIQELNKLIKIQ